MSYCTGEGPIRWDRITRSSSSVGTVLKERAVCNCSSHAFADYTRAPSYLRALRLRACACRELPRLNYRFKRFKLSLHYCIRNANLRSSHFSNDAARMTAIPSTETVQAYLVAYQIESVVEGAVNDAVLKQVKVRVSPRLLSATAALAQPMCLQPRPA